MELDHVETIKTWQTSVSDLQATLSKTTMERDRLSTELYSLSDRIMTDKEKFKHVWLQVYKLLGFALSSFYNCQTAQRNKKSIRRSIALFRCFKA